MTRLTDDHGECAFMDQLAGLLVPWGWSRHVGRIYGYLLLSDGPVTLDKIAADLGIAKSNASVAARTLEKFGNARRYSEPGSKRIYYTAPENLSGPFASKTALFGLIMHLLEANRDIGRTAGVNSRLDSMAQFYADMRDAIQAVIDKYDQAGSATSAITGSDLSSLGNSSDTRSRNLATPSSFTGP